MKTKLLVLIVATIMLFTVFYSMPVMAENGPSDEYAFIYFTGMGESDYKVIYYESTLDNEAMPGATYDKDTNTLTLDNVNTNLVLCTNKMGDDFKIKLVGDNSVAIIRVYGDDYGGNLTITGDGTLTVDTSKFGRTPTDDDEEMNAITLYAENTNAKFTVENTATVNIKAYSSVIAITDTPNNDPSKAIVLKNGQNLSSNIQTEKHYYRDPIVANYVFFDGENWTDITVQIYEKDGKLYGVEQYGESFDVHNLPLVYCETADLYFFDPTYEGVYHTPFDSEEELLAAGYVATGEEATITANTWAT